jgi:mono/diheme cytochrome c family protein
MTPASARTQTIRRTILILLVLFAAVQLVPFGRDHANPPVQREPSWDSRRTRELFFRACKNCHSNETEWPWYSNIAPLSWLVQYDVNKGRKNFNVSEWGRKKNKGDEAADEVREGEMPPWYYLPPHPEARFTPAEREEFIAGLVKTFGGRSGDGKADSERKH